MAHKQFYRNNLTYLTTHFRTTNLLGALFEKGIITQRDREQLQCVVSSEGQIAAAERLFCDILLKKPDMESMYKLCEVLYENECEALTHYFAAKFPEIYDRHPDWDPNPLQTAQRRGHRTYNMNRVLSPQLNNAATSYASPMDTSYGTPMGYGSPMGYAGPMGDVSNTHFANPDPPPGNPAGPINLRGRADVKLTREDQEFIRTISDYVFCIELQQQAVGTGFVLGSKDCQDGIRYYMITNHHVYDKVKYFMNTDPDLSTVHAVFDFQEQGLKGHKVPIDSRVIAWSSELDYALLLLHYSPQLMTKFGNQSKLSKFIICQEEMPRDHCVLTLIGHPKGEKQTADTVIVCNGEAMLRFSSHDVYRSSRARIFYRGTSFEGSSGSPCFDIKGRRLHCMQCGCMQDRQHQIEHGVFLYEVVKDVYNTFIKDGFCKEDFNKLFPEFVNKFER